MKRSPNKKITIADINKIYGKHKEKFITTDNYKLGEQYNLGYGEITHKGFKNILNFIGKPKPTTFIDLGCGNGRALSYAFLNGIKSIIGVEILDERYKFALKAIKKLKMDKVQIVNSDIFELKSSFFPTNCLIFISNLLFPEDTTQNLIRFLSDNVKEDTYIALTVIPKNIYELKIIERINTPMSWCETSQCYILKK
jgi:SAM-dependent methyltransferase